MMRKSRYCINESPVYISDYMTAKMEGVPAISTSCRLNPYCQARAKDPNSICAHCYAEATINQYSDLARHLAHNTELLTSRPLLECELPIFGNVGFVRFEAFGDLINEMQAINYMKIAMANPCVTFSIWTKNRGIWRRACEIAGGKPDNLIAIYSANKLNAPEMLPPYFDKVFTVWDSEEACQAEHFEVNCGARHCAGCRLCYDLNNYTVSVNELLKKKGGKRKKGARK